MFDLQGRSTDREFAVAARKSSNFVLNRSSPLARGLVFWGGGAHSGSSHYHDSSLYGRHGVLEGSAQWEWAPKINRWCVHCNRATSDRVTITGLTADDLDIDAGKVRTIAYWVRIDEVVSSRYHMNIGGTGVSGGNWLVEASTGKLYIRFVGYVAWDITWVTGDWYHIAFVVPASGGNIGDILCWINGVAQGTPDDVSGTVALDTQTSLPLRYGYGNDGSDRYVDCAIADPVIYPRVLTSSEIALLADPGRHSLCRSTQYIPSGRAPAGLSIPVAMHHYQRNLAG